MQRGKEGSEDRAKTNAKVDTHPFLTTEKYLFDKQELIVQYPKSRLSQRDHPDQLQADLETKGRLGRRESKPWSQFSVRIIPGY